MPIISGKSGGSGTVTGVTAADTSIVVAGTAAAPTIATASLAIIAADHASAGSITASSQKITNLANGAGAQDAAAFGQIPASLPPSGAAAGVLSGSYPNPGMAAGAAATNLGAAGGDLTGTYPSPSVVPTLFGIVGWTVVAKASDESVASSTTLQNDDELFFTATSGGFYEIDLLILYANPLGAGTPDLKIAVGEDATIRGSFSVVGVNSSETAAIQQILSNQASNVTVGTAAANRGIRVIGTHVGAGGTFRLLWAQGASDSNPTTVRAGSIIRYRRLV